MRKATLIPMTGLAALLGVQYAGAAQLIYGFDTGDAVSLDGFAGNGATTSQSTTTGVTEGNGALEIANNATQTYGGALTANVPASFYDATSFNVSVTITTTPVANGSAVYFDLVPVFFSTDGEIDPDTSNASNFINVGGVAPGTYTYTVNLAAYYDPDGVLPGDNTPGAILAADSAYDAAQSPPTTDSITGFQLTVEHGGGAATTLYVDNVTVPSVPEPASLGLLALGGLAVKRRNRSV